MAIDPGSSCLGVAIYKLNFHTREIIESSAFTLHAKESFHYSRCLGETFGDKYTRLMALENELRELFQYYNPSIVMCESPFFNSFTPNAYAILTELVNLIQNTLRNYNNHIPFFKVDPPTAKKAVGAKGNAKKEEMTVAIDKIKHQLKLINPVNELDEHSIDALAIGYFGYGRYVTGYN
jgi:crossover junction endodeoxyribonuclease ruvC